LGSSLRKPLNPDPPLFGVLRHNVTFRQSDLGCSPADADQRSASRRRTPDPPASSVGAHGRLLNILGIALVALGAMILSTGLTKQEDFAESGAQMSVTVRRLESVSLFQRAESNGLNVQGNDLAF
jgi:hypothetical protein